MNSLTSYFFILSSSGLIFLGCGNTHVEGWHTHWCTDACFEQKISHPPHPTLPFSVSWTKWGTRALIGRLTWCIVLFGVLREALKIGSFIGVQTEPEGASCPDVDATVPNSWEERLEGDGVGGLRLLLFHFLSAPPCLLAGVQMGASDSSSSSPNWHLTAAPHGLLAGCVSFLFVFFCPSVRSSSAASNIT